MLRARIALAGASAAEQAEGGWLTALEVATLDLYGTRLVVLSGCKTGLGVPHAGEGVYGMRRALVLAGSECQMLSLWSVRDDATAHLMEGFYARLAQGESAAEALRSVQLEMRATPRYQRPYCWAGFVVSGVEVGG
jgi:CHAT domain-containing protein